MSLQTKMSGACAMFFVCFLLCLLNRLNSKPDCVIDRYGQDDCKGETNVKDNCRADDNGYYLDKDDEIK